HELDQFFSKKSSGLISQCGKRRTHQPESSLTIENAHQSRGQREQVRERFTITCYCHFQSLPVSRAKSRSPAIRKGTGFGRTLKPGLSSRADSRAIRHLRS